MAELAKRQHWPSRWIFILAAIGSAAGLGNLWRFPYLAYEHGGAAFVIALLLANIIVGIPLLAAEVALGQKTQKATPDAFAAIKKKFRFLGWFAIVMGFMVLVYYMAVMGWGVNYLGASFNLSWGDDAGAFFFEKILNLSDGPGSVGGISWPVLTGLLIAYVAVYFSVWKGVKSVSKVVAWSATLPFIILLVLMIRALTLDGSAEGVKLFLIPDWSAFKDPQLWIAAFSQVFFSLSLAFGIMVAYGSFNRENTDISKSVIWIVVGNFVVSLMSGFVVFGTLGYMALQQGLPVNEVIAGGPALAFVVFPQAISLLPALNSLIAVVFFAMVLLLGLDSAFSLLEAFSASVKDRYPSVSTKKIALIICIVGASLGVLFTTHAGLYYLDIVDHFVVNYGLVLVGILEAIVLGWLWKKNKILEYINEKSEWKFGRGWKLSIMFIIPIFLTILFIVNLVGEIRTPYEGYPTWALLYIGVLPVVLAPLAGAVIDSLVKGEKEET